MYICGLCGGIRLDSVEKFHCPDCAALLPHSEFEYYLFSADSPSLESQTDSECVGIRRGFLIKQPVCLSAFPGG